MLPPSFDWLKSTSGDSPVTVTDLLQRRRRHHEIDGGLLAQQQLEVAHGAAKPFERRRQVICARAHRQPVLTPLVGDRLEAVTGGVVDGPDRHSGQHAAGRVGDGAGHGRLLRGGSQPAASTTSR